MATMMPHSSDVIGWMRENNSAARVALTLVQFFDVYIYSLPNPDVKCPNLRF